jgi:hypothetical protein
MLVRWLAHQRRSPTRAPTEKARSLLSCDNCSGALVPHDLTLPRSRGGLSPAGARA